jgi:hypothetical protein
MTHGLRRFVLILGAAAALRPACAQMDHAHMDHEMAMPMEGFYGPYPMSREASGTSWQPEAAPHEGLHFMRGPWMAMVHGFVNASYDNQTGPRGDEKTFSASMIMGMARREYKNGVLGLRAMLSLDPAMGARGYPLLFAAGETADGREQLVDRQHPHDLFMELAASWSVPLGERGSVFVYGGLPGEPALGPPTFMHRFSGMEIPEAPIDHHWLDSTHITFGVVTLGGVWNDLKFEGSAFNGREPDQHRWNFEVRRFDSWSARVSWNPDPHWALQVSRGRLDSPEQLEPDIAVERTTASASFHVSPGGAQWQTTLAWGQNARDPGATTNGYLLESTCVLGGRHTVFGRAERVANDELIHDGGRLEGRAFGVGKLSAGYLFDFARVRQIRLGAGVLASVFSVPEALEPVYGAHPNGYFVFVRGRL